MNQIREAKFSLADGPQHLQVSPNDIRREIKRGNPASYRIAGQLRFGESHLLEYLTRRERKARLID